MRLGFESTYLRHKWRIMNPVHCRLVGSTRFWLRHMRLAGIVCRMEGSLQWGLLSARVEARCLQARLLLLFQVFLFHMVVQDYSCLSWCWECAIGLVAVRIGSYLGLCRDFALGSGTVRNCSYLGWCWSVQRNLERESARYLAGLK